MKVTKIVTCEHEVEFNISTDDIEVIYDNQPESIRAWLKQMNDIAIFLKGSPQEFIDKLSYTQAMTISEGLIGLARKLIDTKHD